MNNKNACRLSVGFRKATRNHRRNHCFTKSYDIRQEETVVATQHLISLHNGIALVLEICHARRQIH